MSPRQPDKKDEKRQWMELVVSCAKKMGIDPDESFDSNAENPPEIRLKDVMFGAVLANLYAVHRQNNDGTHGADTEIFLDNYIMAAGEYLDALGLSDQQETPVSQLTEKQRSDASVGLEQLANTLLDYATQPPMTHERDDDETEKEPTTTSRHYLTVPAPTWVETTTEKSAAAARMHWLMPR